MLGTTKQARNEGATTSLQGNVDTLQFTIQFQVESGNYLTKTPQS
jgi:hypothetical protein